MGEIESIRSGLVSETTWVEPPAGLENAVVAAIMETNHPNTDRSITARDSEGKRVNRRPVVLFLGSVAAALVLVVGAFSMLARTPEPDWEAAMVGTDDARAATAVIAGWNTDAGTRLLLEASNLDIAPEGSVYQLWFSNDSTDVSAGTFTDPSRVELTVGVARKDYPDVWLSLQPIDARAGGAGPPLMRTADISS